MYNYEVDVPVRVNIWIRTECQQKQFEVLKKARPSILFLISDGGRNEKEWNAIRQNRKLIDDGIDWECTVYRIYEDKNNGLYTMSKKATELIWSTVDRCIFLEDDYVPSVSYFKFCAELLEKYKDDTRINAICGMNHAGVWEDTNSDYFFAKEGSIWGMAFWKRSVKNRELGTAYASDPYVINLLKQSTRLNISFWKRIIGYINNPHYEGHVPGGEFFHSMETYGQNRLFIIPKQNMMCNIGCTADSAHADEYRLIPKTTQKMFFMKTYEVEGELKHPTYMIDDVNYDKYVLKMLGVGHPILNLGRHTETIWLRLRYQGVKGIIKKIKHKISNKNRIEN